MLTHATCDGALQLEKNLYFKGPKILGTCALIGIPEKKTHQDVVVQGWNNSGKQNMLGSGDVKDSQIFLPCSKR